MCVITFIIEPLDFVLKRNDNISLDELIKQIVVIFIRTNIMLNKRKVKKKFLVF